MSTDGTPAPYMLITAHFRRQIIDGELAPGTQLPGVRAIAEQFSVAHQTAANAIAQLAVEGYVYTSPRRGAFVSDTALAASTPRDRLDRVQRTGSIHGKGETVRVTSAALVVPPVYVGELFGLDAGDQVVRREWVTGRGQDRLSLSVSWHPATFAVQVPDLLSTDAGKADHLITQIMHATGRRITHARDDFHARAADRREAGLLGLHEGSIILAGAHRWSDDLGMVEYGEWCLPELHTIGYEYTPTP